MHADKDLVILGGTPAGIGAAVAAARKGSRVIMLEPSAFIGGMMTSGLGLTDIRSTDTSGSIFDEFRRKVLSHYVKTYGANSQQVKDCNNGLHFEPSVARKVMHEIIEAEPNIEVRRSQELIAVEMEERRIKKITVFDHNDGQSSTFSGAFFIDATYEGDLAAMAGVPYVVGRESRDEWNEEFAGKLYCEYKTKEILPGSTGEGDDAVQAYNFRLCLTDRPDNRIDVTKPENYNREYYVSLIDDIHEGRVRGVGEVIKLSRIPNGKTDTNNFHNCLVSTDFPEENQDYPEGNHQTRAEIAARHREYIQGLLWFLQHDEQLPLSFREEARQWGYAADEFTETDHFPPQIYVREARRMKGMYWFTENDARLAPGLDRSPIHYDSIGTGDYAIDSHACRKREPGQNRALEGFLGFNALTEVYQIPYGVIVPENVENLLVPTAVSATHMGFGTIRMEPFWMQLGFAAGTAAELCRLTRSSVQQLSIDLLQDELLEKNQKITYFKDLPADHRASAAMQYFGCKGWFTSYDAEPDKPCTLAEAAQWIALARALPGGMRLPALPASDQIQPVGVDIGPRKLNEEMPRRTYWQQRPYLTNPMFRRWLHAANKLLKIDVNLPAMLENDPYVTRGNFAIVLYELLKTSRKRIIQGVLETGAVVFPGTNRP